MILLMTKTIYLQNGQKFGKLTVIKLHHIEDVPTKTWMRHIEYYLCKCECGKECVRNKQHLTRTSQPVTSCGCLKKAQALKMVEMHVTHRQTKTPLYRRWDCIKRRCADTRPDKWRRYGARGITVCEEWRNSFEAFRDWALTHGYKPELTIDRIDNDKGYSPDNCRWITPFEQNRNQSTNRWIEYNGEKLILKDWALKLGLPTSTLANRLRRGWPLKYALSRDRWYHKHLKRE